MTWGWSLTALRRLMCLQNTAWNCKSHESLCACVHEERLRHQWNMSLRQLHNRACLALHIPVAVT
jgi:hypothetical protein